MNPMKEIRIDKVTVNIGLGESGDRLDKAVKLLSSFTKNKVVSTVSKRRSTFGVPKGRPIGAKVTLRGEEAEAFLKKALDAKGHKIKESSIDSSGNLSFGIHEHIDMSGVKYDPTIGIFGMDVCITLERPGFRVKRRIISNKVGKTHMITKQESVDFIKKKFGVEII